MWTEVPDDRRHEHRKFLVADLLPLTRIASAMLASFVLGGSAMRSA
jgi:hypothetical protein